MPIASTDSQTTTSTFQGSPELLAPAGDRDCLRAAIENGADAVYFGLQAHNARARATNFSIDELPVIMATLHRRGVRGYVTLNTLIFPAELDGAETLLRRVAEAGADAIIAQDVGLCRLARATAPGLEIHASTQMSITSGEGVRFAESLGCSRVILARELSVREIAKIRAESTLPLEVFVHGALCVAYSGQCLTSEALGGRSANRGECAQACRLPYQIVSDGRAVDLGEIRYLLSPQDLAAFDLVPELVRAGVASLKIEGRLKTPEYVANVTHAYRKAIDGAVGEGRAHFEPREIQELELSFSRGFSPGFLLGNDHKRLVRGDYSKKRGLALGKIERVVGDRVLVDLSAPLKPGDGLVIDGDETLGLPEQGGRVYEVARPGRGGPVGPDGLESGPALIGFGRLDVDTGRLMRGQRVWKTDDPALGRRLRSSYEGPPSRLVHLDLEVLARSGEPLKIHARASNGQEAEVSSDEPLAIATRHPTSRDDLELQLGRLGGTIYRLDSLSSTIEGGPMVPKSLANALRRTLVERLDAIAARRPEGRVAPNPVLPSLRESARSATVPGPFVDDPAPRLLALCRDGAQAVAAAQFGASVVYLDFNEVKALREAVEAVRDRSGAEVFVATPRIEKPGETPIFRHLAKLGADGLLVRNAGGLAFCERESVPFVADFAMNAANELAVAELIRRGARRVTASYDLSDDQLDGLADAVPPGSLEIVIHQHMPMFHMEHCVFCAFLSPGRDKTDCGRPCDRHQVELRDRVGVDHPLTADVGCRNTLFNAVPQSAAEFLPRLLKRGARHLRVEFLRDGPAEVARTLGLYADALRGRSDPRGLWRALKASNRYGVTRGQLAVLD